MMATTPQRCGAGSLVVVRTYMIKQPTPKRFGVIKQYENNPRNVAEVVKQLAEVGES